MSHAAPGSAAVQLGPYAAVFAPLEGRGRADVVAQRLADSIAFGMLPDGSPLPAEADLAERFGVAPVTVREALARLRDEGLIRTVRGRRGGSFACVPADGGRAALMERLAHSGIGELRDLADHYATISGATARLAAQRADPHEVARLQELAERVGSSPAEVARAEGRFHVDLAAATQSARLTREEVALQAEVGPVLWAAHALVGDPAALRRGHLAMADAVARGDGAAARDAAEAHVADMFATVHQMVRDARRAR